MSSGAFSLYAVDIFSMTTSSNLAIYFVIPKNFKQLNIKNRKRKFQWYSSLNATRTFSWSINFSTLPQTNKSRQYVLNQLEIHHQILRKNILLLPEIHLFLSPSPCIIVIVYLYFIFLELLLHFDHLTFSSVGFSYQEGFVSSLLKL